MIISMGSLHLVLSNTYNPSNILLCTIGLNASRDEIKTREY